MRGQRKESMIYSSAKVKRCTLVSGSLPRAQSLGVLDISNLSISSIMRRNMTSLLLYLLRFQASLTLSLSFQCRAARILSIKSMHFWFSKFLVPSSTLNTSCSSIISSKCLRKMFRLRYTCALVQFRRQYSLMSALSTSSLPFDRQAMLFSTIPTTLSASKDSALTFPVTSSRQSTSPFRTESLSSRARLSFTQICSPLPPENTNMSCSKPKSYSRAFSMISTAVTSNFQHFVHTFFPSQHVRTSSQSFMSKSKMSSLSTVLAFESFSGVRFQTAPASTLRGVASLELLELAIILFLKALASTKVTYLSTTLPSNSKESSRWASWDLLLWVSHRTTVSKGYRQLQQIRKSYTDIWREKILQVSFYHKFTQFKSNTHSLTHKKGNSCQGKLKSKIKEYRKLTR